MQDYLPGENPTFAERLSKLNKKLVTFCAVALLFLASLGYLVAVAFENEGTLEKRQSPTREAIKGFDEL